MTPFYTPRKAIITAVCLLLIGVVFLLCRQPTTLADQFLIVPTSTNLLSASLVAITTGTNHSYKHVSTVRHKCAEWVAKAGFLKASIWVRGSFAKTEANGFLKINGKVSGDTFWVHVKWKPGLKLKGVAPGGYAFGITNDVGAHIGAWCDSFEDVNSTIVAVHIRPEHAVATNSVIYVTYSPTTIPAHPMPKREQHPLGMYVSPGLVIPPFEVFTIQPRPSH